MKKLFILIDVFFIVGGAALLIYNLFNLNKWIAAPGHFYNNSLTKYYNEIGSFLFTFGFLIRRWRK